MMCSYAEDKGVVWGKTEKEANRFLTSFLEMVMRISRAFLKWCMTEASEIIHFGNHPCCNWTGNLKRSSTHPVRVQSGRCVVPLVPLPLVRAGTYKPSFTLVSAATLWLAEAHSESKESVASLVTEE